MVSFRDKKIQTFRRASPPLSYVESPPTPPPELYEGDIFEITVVCLLLLVLGSKRNEHCTQSIPLYKRKMTGEFNKR